MVLKARPREWEEAFSCIWIQKLNEYLLLSSDHLLVILSATLISLDPDSDPLCMLLLIDFLTLRSREYRSLLQLYQDWEVKCCVVCNIYVLTSACYLFSLTQELLCVVIHFQVHRNLSQLPNFAFSTALCHFHLSQQEDMDPEESGKLRQKADEMLQNALIMFPGG